MDIKQQTYDLIDSLKAVCHSYGLNGDGNEYKIITQVFLYKFLNDKFGYEIKKISPKLASAEKWEEEYAAMPEGERQDLLDRLSPDVLQLQPEHLIGFLWNNQSKGDFGLIFDSTMVDIAEKNADIFSTHTSQNTRILLFETLTNYITDESQKSAFARALIDKLAKFSFEEAFKEKYDFFAGIFEYLIKDYNTAGGGEYAEYYTPHAIAVIMARLLVGDNSDLHSVECYDPSAGTGTLLMALAHQVGEEKSTIFSQDISQKSSKMLKLNLILNSLVASLDNAIQGNTMTEPYHKSDDGSTLRQFDFVVSNPPFKMNFSEDKPKMDAQPSRFWGGVPNIKPNQPEKSSIYPCFIQHVVNSIKDKSGKGAIVIPTGFLTAKNGVEYAVRKAIVDERIVAGVVSMPSNVFANTGTNVSVLFFDKSKQHDDVILIDASNLGEEYKEGKNKKRRLTGQEIDLIVNSYLERESVDDFSVKVSFEDIEEKGYSLSAGQFFDIKIEYVEMDEDEYKSMIKDKMDELEGRFEKSRLLEQSIIEKLGGILDE